MSLDPLREGRNRLLNGWQLSKLYTFEVAARHQSFALAADELSLSPSAVSHRINQLEDELGIQLFVRSHPKVELKTRSCPGRLPSTHGLLSPSAGWFRRSATLPVATRQFH